MKILLRTLAVVAGLVALWLGACWIVLMHPSSDPDAPADARLFLASDGGHRAWETHRPASASETLVLSRPASVRSMPIYTACDAEATCFVPDPETTQGEAEAFTRLAREHGWRSVTIYTHTSHVARTRVRFAQCFPGTIRVVAVDNHPSPGVLWAEFVHETAGWAKVLVTPRCGDRVPGGD